MSLSFLLVEYHPFTNMMSLVFFWLTLDCYKDYSDISYIVKLFMELNNILNLTQTSYRFEGSSEFSSSQPDQNSAGFKAVSGCSEPVVQRSSESLQG